MDMQTWQWNPLPRESLCPSRCSLAAMALGSALLSGACMAQGQAGSPLQYMLIYTTATVVTTAQAPFTGQEQVAGYVTLPAGAESGNSFSARNPPDDTQASLPVTDFLFNVADYQWTPVGQHGILGFTDAVGNVTDATMGFERDACGSLSPCYLDIISNHQGNFNLLIYQPASGTSSGIVGYSAQGVELVLAGP